MYYILLLLTLFFIFTDHLLIDFVIFVFKFQTVSVLMEVVIIVMNMIRKNGGIPYTAHEAQITHPPYF